MCFMYENSSEMAMRNQEKRRVDGWMVGEQDERLAEQASILPSETVQKKRGCTLTGLNDGPVVCRPIS